MPKTMDVAAYRYEELSENARDSIRYNDQGTQQEVCNDVSDRLQDMLGEILGCSVEGPHARRRGDVTLAWSLGYCQGDGVAWYGSWSAQDTVDAIEKIASGQASGGWWDEGNDCHKHIRRDLDAALPTLRELAKHGYTIVSNEINTHYCHYNTMGFEAEFHGCPMADLGNTECAYVISDEAWKTVEEFFRQISRTLEREGYEYLEACESLDDMKYRFAGAWFDEGGRVLEWDDDRDEHIAQLERADSERLRTKTD